MSITGLGNNRRCAKDSASFCTALKNIVDTYTVSTGGAPESQTRNRPRTKRIKKPVTEFCSQARDILILRSSKSVWG
jgi:hypothetical protein